MAVSIVQTLQRHGRIDQDDLAGRFATAFANEPTRGYGPGARQLLYDIANGGDWRAAALALFGGEGSMGNGGAMRAAPVGAFFADNLERVTKEAKLSAAVTHAHPEGQAGAVGVAVAAALAAQVGADQLPPDSSDLFSTVIDHVPDGLMKTNLKQAAMLPSDTSLHDVVHTLGNGSRILAFDTVPYSLWCAFHNLSSYEEALWTCVTGGGDVDTTAAIVGGVVSLSAGHDAVPREWIRAREPYSLADRVE